MKHLKRVTLLSLVMVGIILMNIPFAGAEDDPYTSTTTVHLFSDASEVDGAWSKLTRFDSGVKMTLHTAELPAGDVVTAWWVVFNSPENCSDNACGEDDIFLFEDDEMVIDDNGAVLNAEQIEAADISLLGATGNVIDEDGNGHFSAWLNTGENPSIVFGNALVNPTSAEIHIVLRTHGQMDEELLDDQITEFNGGCSAEFPNEPCLDIQFAVHAPPTE